MTVLRHERHLQMMSGIYCVMSQGLCALSCRTLPNNSYSTNPSRRTSRAYPKFPEIRRAYDKQSRPTLLESKSGELRASICQEDNKKVGACSGMLI